MGSVIGSVTLKRVHPILTGARWILVAPMSLEALKSSLASGEPAGEGEEIVVYDAPFSPKKVPVDAYCGLLLDQVVLEDRK